MTGVAHHINEMKRQHEVAVHVQVELRIYHSKVAYNVKSLMIDSF